MSATAVPTDALNRDSPAKSTAVLLALGTLGLGLALHLNDGLYSVGAVRLLAGAFGLCVMAITLPPWPIPRIVLQGTLLLVVTGQMIAMLCRRAGASELTVPQVNQQPYHVGLLIALVLAGIIGFSGQRIARAAFVGLLVVFAALGVWKIRTAPAPKIDVFVFQTDAADALGRLKNPYAITFPNIYGPETAVYGPGIVSNGRLLFGYPYPPIVLMITAPVQWALGDYRYAQLGAMLIAAAGIAVLRRDSIGLLSAATLLFTPRAIYILEMGWTEPISAMLLVLTVAAAERSGVLMGLFAASKQYLPVMLLLARRRAMIIAAITGLVVTAPLALWDIKAFAHSVITLQLHQPYRADSLSFLAWYGAARAGWTGPFWLAFVALGAGIAVAAWRGAGFALGVAFSLFCFIAFNKQAFANYYYLVIAAMCAAVARENWSMPVNPSDKEIIGPCAAASSSSSF